MRLKQYQKKFEISFPNRGPIASFPILLMRPKAEWAIDSETIRARGIILF